MEWTQDYHLFLFDFDGLLVDTEALHLEAYRRMCAEKGHTLDLDLGKSLFSVLCKMERVSLSLQHLGQKMEHQRFIIDEKDLFKRHDST